MTTTPNPQALREYTLEYLRRYVTNIDHGAVLDEMLCDERFAHLMTGDEDRDISTLDPIAAKITDQAKVLAGTLSWPTERLQDPQPWPRAQCMPLAIVGQRPQPWHHQALAEYGAVTGTEMEPNPNVPGGYVAAQINWAISWWNERVEAEQVAGEQDAELAEVVVRLKRWLAGRQGKAHSKVSTTSVIAEPRDRSTAIWAIAESDVAAVVAALEARGAKDGE